MLADIVSDPDEALHGAHWMLRFTSALVIQAGLLHLLAGQSHGGVLALGGVGLFLVSFISQFWIRLLLLVSVVFFLFGDFAVRRNPFSLVFSLPLIWHAVVLLLSKMNRVQASGDKPS